MPIMKLGIGRCLQITYGKLKNDEYEKYITKLESCWVKFKFTAEGRRRRIRWRRGLRCRTQEQLRWRRESLVSGRSGRWEKKVYYSFCSNFSPEPAKEEHARHCADKEDGLKIEVLGLSLSLWVQPVRRRGSRIPRRPSRDRSLSTCALTC